MIPLTRWLLYYSWWSWRQAPMTRQSSWILAKGQSLILQNLKSFSVGPQMRLHEIKVLWGTIARVTEKHHTIHAKHDCIDGNDSKSPDLSHRSNSRLWQGPTFGHRTSGAAYIWNTITVFPMYNLLLIRCSNQAHKKQTFVNVEREILHRVEACNDCTLWKVQARATSDSPWPTPPHLCTTLDQYCRGMKEISHRLLPPRYLYPIFRGEWSTNQWWPNSEDESRLARDIYICASGYRQVIEGMANDTLKTIEVNLTWIKTLRKLPRWLKLLLIGREKKKSSDDLVVYKRFKHMKMLLLQVLGDMDLQVLWAILNRCLVKAYTHLKSLIAFLQEPSPTGAWAKCWFHLLTNKENRVNPMCFQNYAVERYLLDQ